MALWGSSTSKCGQCVQEGGKTFATPISMAFQPVYDTGAGYIYAHEALVRPAAGGTAAEVLAVVTDENRYAFDQTCRVRAIELAARLKMTESLSINFMPNAVYDPERCLQTTLAAADAQLFPVEQIIFEFTEAERMYDHAHVRRIVTKYRARGFRTAIDDFGAGHNGLNLLADAMPDMVKVSAVLVRGVMHDPMRRSILRAIKQVADEHGVVVIAKGVETEAELAALADLGVTLVQGFAIAAPLFEGLVTARAIRAARGR